jgi:hypothetical protein
MRDIKVKPGDLPAIRNIALSLIHDMDQAAYANVPPHVWFPEVLQRATLAHQRSQRWSKRRTCTS